jgi:hypothetical protein
LNLGYVIFAQKANDHPNAQSNKVASLEISWNGMSLLAYKITYLHGILTSEIFSQEKNWHTVFR